ncbi:MAG: 4-hydroxy-3-methylbut-2-enyl diphosphate reductase [Chlamydiae bacterium RIFCSPLOWO2_01_FULL_28_7]|nr:MAG: 4-hydroxy-3-methylbut-2-enyl diphosphate reductase [Chlamydiae bacterium RIFCSPLOWO2_01_FULL_28_7]
MKLYLINPRGFCAGVVRAIQTVEEALKIYGPPIYVKHEIVHNKHVVNSLKQKGAIFIEDISKVPANSVLIYSAHGIPPQIREEAKKKSLLEIDATCVLVTKIHSAVKRFSKKGYKIILIGKKKHVEVIGIAGVAIKDTFVIENEKDIDNLFFLENQKVFYITQTTLSIDDVKIIVEKLTKKFPNIETLASESICYATTNRQKALKTILDKIDLLLVIGDPSSSNSTRLKEIGSRNNIKSYLINQDIEIQKEWFENVSSIAVTAGASTPEYIVQECIEKIKTFKNLEIINDIYISEDVVFSLPKELYLNTKSIKNLV